MADTVCFPAPKSPGDRQVSHPHQAPPFTQIRPTIKSTPAISSMNTLHTTPTNVSMMAPCSWRASSIALAIYSLMVIKQQAGAELGRYGHQHMLWAHLMPWRVSWLHAAPCTHSFQPVHTLAQPRHLLIEIKLVSYLYLHLVSCTWSGTQARSAATKQRHNVSAQELEERGCGGGRIAACSQQGRQPPPGCVATATMPCCHAACQSLQRARTGAGLGLGCVYSPTAPMPASSVYYCHCPIRMLQLHCLSFCPAGNMGVSLNLMPEAGAQCTVSL